MASHSQFITLIRDTERMQAKAPFDTGHFIRASVKFLLALSAAGCAAYSAYEIWQKSETQKRSNISRREEPQKKERTFFQALIEADREALKGHAKASSLPQFNFWRGLQGKSDSAGTSGQGRSETPASRVNLRAFFTADGGNYVAVNKEAAWKMAYLSTSAAPARAAAPIQQPAASPPAIPAPDVHRPAQNASTSVQTRPQPAGPVVAPDAPARPPSKITEAKPVPAAPPGREAGAKRAAPGFLEVGAGAGKAPPRPAHDDLEFANAAANAAETDFQVLPRAHVVAAEFSRRYPHSAEAAQLHSRVNNAQAKHAQALSERSSLNPDTPVAPVLFHEAARAALQTCLAAVAGLEQLAIVTRPVAVSPNRLAFLAAARLKRDGLGIPGGRESFLENARVRLTAELGPCLHPMFTQGTVALSISDGHDSDLTRQRIETAAGAVVFERTSPAAHAAGGETTAATPASADQ